jgi:hypothetical protein
MLSAQKCASCKKPVSDREGKVSVQGHVFHPKCVFCEHCREPLATSDSIFRRDDKIYCKQHYMDFFCKVCTGCGKHILDHCIGVHFEYYHPECLRCAVCDKKLERYVCVSGYLRCGEHQENDLPTVTCSVCTKNIYGEVIRSCGQKVHPDCFNCAFCEAKLSKAEVKLRSAKLCCKNCIASKDPPAPKPDLSKADRSADFSSIRESDSPEMSQSGALSGSLKVSIIGPPGGGSAGGAASPVGDGKLHDSKLAKPEAKGEAKGEPREPPSEVKVDSKDSKESKNSKDSKSDVKASAIEGALPDEVEKQEKIVYRKGALIGQGAFGKVFEAMNLSTGELIAVKQVTLDEDSPSAAEALSEIENEINLMRKLRHRNIVRLLDTDREGNTLSILMEYVPGKSLDNLLQKYGSLGEPVIRNYTKQILLALAYCHSLNVVHRDIKGKNILVDKTGRLKLADFGSAKHFQNMDYVAPTSSYNYTPLWTAPEVLVGDYNNKVDVWSLGCVIIEMASARAPWSEQNFENPFRALYHIGNSGSIPKIPDGLSPLGVEFVKLCLQRDPDKRPSALELINHKWLEGVKVD